ncbi:hypothetical protein N7508_004002 [Penicillium antarcticum]|uniref:uncharacterized protein n=1 Tax=Penicillium antarcticum TaxID=416450 RepID=UPI002388D7C7|nr:uncharacterized protein N7508_004002 [Penicillium antarcticum]KAJ5308623.1 hypothetical protein N7508_004002 [Penicillium antarcticum]
MHPYIHPSPFLEAEPKPNARQIKELSTKVREYESMLSEIRDLPGSPAKRIRDLLQKYDPDSGYASNATPLDLFQDQGKPDRSSSPSSIGSLEAVDRVEDDINRTENSRATGFLGKSSEITWLKRLKEEEQQSLKSTPDDDRLSGDRIPPHTINYHLDDLSIDVPEAVQMYWVPPREVADRLFETYLLMVHPQYPIINRTQFSVQYRNFFDRTHLPSDRWMAVLNMVFAIASNISCNTGIAGPGSARDHLLYMTRARMFGMGGDNLFRHPDLQQVQVEGLIAFHLLSINQINRAWRISVLAVRSAISLGINLKNESHSISGHTKELHCRIWWCLFTVEHKLGLMTGRKTAISFKTFSSQLPLPLDEDQLLEPSAIRLLENLEVREQRLNRAMTSPCLLQMDSKPTKDTLLGRSWLRSLPAGAAVYFLYQCDLTALTQEILNRVYSVECAMLSWEEIKGRINHLETTVDSWLSNLPPALKFTHLEEENSEAQRAKTSLAFHYYSTQIMLGRPCLCRHTTQNKEDDIHGFTYRMSVSTLDSAMHMLDLLPDEPDTTYIYQTCPWWCMLHYIMQTATVIILELSFGCVHIPEKENSLMKLGGKSVQWLYAMSGHSIAAHRAWQLCEGALSRLALRLGYYSSNLPFRPNEQQIKSEVDSAYSSLLGQRDKTVEPGTLSAHDDQPPSQTHSQEDSIASWGGINSNLADLLGSELSSAPGTHGGSASDMHFPYDPITGEFLRAFFPELKEEQWGL